MKAKKNGGFTLVEMVVAAGIIALLLALVFPSLQNSIVLARSSKCAGNLRSLGVSFRLYAADYDGVLPPSYVVGNNGPDNNWWFRLSPYTGAKAMATNWGAVTARSMESPFHCPMVKNPDPTIGNNAWVSYKMNSFLRQQSSGTATGVDRGVPLVKVSAPSRTLLVAEGRQHPEFDRYDTNSIPWGLWYPHGKTLNGLFVDGHVETFTQSSLAARWEDIAQYPLGR